jgi:hypothetical protein
MVGFPFAIPVWNGASAKQPVTKARVRSSSRRKPPAIRNAHTVAANAITKTVSQTTFATFQGRAAIGAMTTGPPKGPNLDPLKSDVLKSGGDRRRVFHGELEVD